MNDPLFPAPLRRSSRSTKPWRNPLFVGPPTRRALDDASRSDEKRQQKAAVNTWEDEGGSTAGAVTGRPFDADSTRRR
jgi:hypothetical protein